MAEHHELYRRAIYYDVVFNRDVSREVDFVAAVYQRRHGRALRSVLDLACGPGYHARAFARRGLQAIGLDLRAEMIAFARQQAADEGASLEWVVADMRDFRLPHPVDAACCMFDGIDCLLSNDELVEHFRAVAANLTAHGLYVIDLTHPRDCSLGDYGTFRYEGRRNGCQVTIDWATNQPAFAPVSQTASVEVTMRVNENGGEEVFVDQATERFLTAQEIVALATLSGVLRVCDWYGDFDLDQPLDRTPASRRMIAVLEKLA